MNGRRWRDDFVFEPKEIEMKVLSFCRCLECLVHDVEVG
jgi:hypothetical protein